MSTGKANGDYSLTASSKVSTIFGGDLAASDEGSYFVSVLAPTASTAVACTTKALADTNPALALFNDHPTGGYNVYLRYIKANMTVVAGSNTHLAYSAICDNVLANLTTLGTVIGAPVNVNTSSGTTSRIIGYGGVNVKGTTSQSGRQVGSGQVEAGLPVAFDEFVFCFGNQDLSGGMVGTQTLVKRIVVPCAPVIIAPRWWFTLGLWGASQAASAATIGWEIGFIERPAGQ
jgi:hypothetical protein